MSITLITPTGGRPLAFALCELWMARQTRKWDQWVVVDDCDPPTKCIMGQEVVRPEPRWEPGQNTQARNLEVAFPLVRGDKVFIIEDDDYYAPRYIEVMSRVLDDLVAVGEVPAMYYNLRTRQWRNNLNIKHASLCQTACRRSALKFLHQACLSGEKFIDMRFWAHVREILPPPALITHDAPLSVGIKGLPGRFGIGSGHCPSPSYRQDDERFDMLYHLVGADAALYLDIQRSAYAGL